MCQLQAEVSSVLFAWLQCDLMHRVHLLRQQCHYCSISCSYGGPLSACILGCLDGCTSVCARLHAWQQQTSNSSACRVPGLTQDSTLCPCITQPIVSNKNARSSHQKGFAHSVRSWAGLSFTSPHYVTNVQMHALPHARRHCHVALTFETCLLQLCWCHRI